MVKNVRDEPTTSIVNISTLKMGAGGSFEKLERLTAYSYKEIIVTQDSTFLIYSINCIKTMNCPVQV
jgi:hypothetical protein